MKNILILLSFLLVASAAISQNFEILSLKEQAEVRDSWLKERFKQVTPSLMRREGIDMWLVISREYNEDPVMKTMLPATWLSARRTTMLVMYDNGREIETYSKIATKLDLEPSQILFLSDIVEELEAANEIGYQTVQLVRPGTDSKWEKTVADFSEIVIIN